MKKVLSLVLVIAMVLSSMSFAFAGTFADVTGDYEDAVEALVALGVIKGYPDGSFKPGNTLTRAELAVLLVQSLGYDGLVAGSKSNYSDTQTHWSNGYVAIATGTGLVQGYPDGTFRPDNGVSYDEAITMVLRAVGYADSALKGTWPTNFKVKAIDLDLLDGVKMATASADRGGVAQIIYNALELPMMELGEENVLVQVKPTKLFIANIATPDTVDEVLPKHLDPDHKDYLGDVVDLTPYMYEEIEVYTIDDEVVYVTESLSDTVTGVFEAETATLEIGIDVDGSDNEYDVATDAAIKVYYNGLEVKMTEGQMEGKDASTSVDLKGADVKAVLNEDDEVVAVVANKYTGVKQATKAYNGKSIQFANITLPLTKGDVDLDKLTVTGAVEDIADVEADDVLVIYAAGGLKTIDTAENLKLVVVRDTVEGKITKINSDGEFYIDGTYYEASLYKAVTFATGNEGIFFLDDKGDLYTFEEDTSSDPTDYAIVTKVVDGVSYDNPATTAVEKIILQDPEVTLVNAKGEKVTYEVDRDSEDADLLSQTNDLDVVLSQYDIVKYTVEDNMLTAVTVKKSPVSVTEPTSETDTTKSTFVLADNALVFNFVDNTDDTKDKVEVIDAADLGDKVKVLTKIENSNGEIELLFVYGAGETTGTYVYVTDDATVLNDDDEPVQEIIGYVNGELVSYETNAANKVTSTAIDAAKLFKLTFEGGIVTVAQDVTANEIVDATVTKVSDNRFRIGSTTETYEWFTLADDVVVYVLDDGEFNYVGDESSVYDEAVVVGYAFDSDNALENIVEILFIFE